MNSRDGNAPLNVFAVPLEGPGAMWMMPKPRADSLAKDMAQLRAMGVERVLSLLEPSEAEALGLSGQAKSAQAAGLIFQSFPIPDRGVPEAAAFFALMDVLRADLAAGARLLVHCHGGIGRSGLVACALAAPAGARAHEVIAHVSAARGLEVPETQAQRDLIAQALARI
ncbi:MAG: tyrosine protein phosphatase [Pseudomonadota bacterium]